MENNTGVFSLKIRTNKDFFSKRRIPYFAYNGKVIGSKLSQSEQIDGQSENQCVSFHPIVILIKENYVYYLNARSKKENGQNWPGEVEVNLFAKQAYVNISLSFLRIQKL
ncbi:hypothetical protein OF376_03140 [Ureaplasma miroungigenitalium]|uniref:Uncharacterized protein n=1 Tax=Ureaplasma miroungigenitalium TaxID=1042321 RepID=A0ABT3BNH2_9BACT|nr:hypothetical protein [Ureaplasma miroungigenitalium]MCV3728755.1 hypothetical protein [Ureaplasma miroungigenitalium]